MADRAGTISAKIIGGGAVLIALLTLSLGTLLVVMLHAEGFNSLSSYDWAAVKFTVWQASLSALFSILGAIPTARALARQRFVGRQFLITLLGAPFILPVIVGVLGLLAVFGRSGWIAGVLGLVGLEPISIYGPWGVVLAHVFFNLPLATRLILQGWLEIPAERIRLTQSLNAGAMARFQLLEFPMLKQTVPGAFLLVFLLCLTSFAVALAVGGGPKATTIELAIYQAFRFDFDLGKAAVLSTIQFALCMIAAFAAFAIPLPKTQGAGLDRIVSHGTGTWTRRGDMGVITLVALFLIMPLTAVLLNGVAGLTKLPFAIFTAAGTSILIALLSTATCILMALALSISLARYSNWASKLGEGIGVLGLATSPLVVGTGLFLIIYPFARPSDFSISVTVLVNAMMALPFALRVISPAVGQVYADFLRLRSSLDMGAWSWLRWIVLPRIKRPMGFAAGLAAALSMGDLGVIALFADPDVQTLPLAVYRLMGAYRMEQAAGAALVLVALSLALFWIFDRGGRVGATS